MMYTGNKEEYQVIWQDTSKVAVNISLSIADIRALEPLTRLGLPDTLDTLTPVEREALGALVCLAVVPVRHLAGSNTNTNE